MLLRQIKYFIAVAECKNFTEAAEQCYISQSAISQQIQALEKDLGVKLLVREKRKFAITPAGEYFYRQGLLLLDDVSRIRRETMRISQDNEKLLKIGYLNGYSGSELHYAVSEFSELYPDTSIQIVNGTHEEIYDLLRFGEADLVINDHRRAFSGEYVNVQLAEHICYAEISGLSTLSSLEYVTPDELKNIPCILISSKSQQRHERDYYKNTLGFVDNFIFAENLEEGRLMVAANKGFMLIDGAENFRRINAATCCIPLYCGEMQMKRSYCAFWKKENVEPQIEQFAKILLKKFQNEAIMEKKN